jgi:hypothetical protein
VCNKTGENAMNKTLLPCPFCGKENPILFHPKKAKGDYFNWSIKCVHGCSIQIDGYDDPESAIAAWNRRPDVEETSLEMLLPELCDCGEQFPPNGKCDFCGARARYLTNVDW